MNFQYVVLGIIMFFSSVFVMQLLHHKLIFIMPVKLVDDIVSAVFLIWTYVGARLVVVGLSRAKRLPPIASALHLFPNEQEMTESREWLGETIHNSLFFGGNRILFMVVLSLLFVFISAFIVAVNTVLPVNIRQHMNIPLTIYGVLSIYGCLLIALRVALYAHRRSLTNQGVGMEPKRAVPEDKTA